MGFLRRLRAMFSSEAAEMRDKLDATLTRKEAELNATPAERVDMTLEKIEAEKDVFDRIEDKIDGDAADIDAEAQVREVLTGEELDTADDGPSIDERIDAAGDAAKDRAERRVASEERAEEILDELRAEMQDPD